MWFRSLGFKFIKASWASSLRIPCWVYETSFINQGSTLGDLVANPRDKTLTPNL